VRIVRVTQGQVSDGRLALSHPFVARDQQRLDAGQVNSPKELEGLQQEIQKGRAAERKLAQFREEIKRYPTFAKLLWWRTYVPMRMRALGLQLGDGVEFFGQPNREETIYRSKAVGEPPLMLALSAFQALRDAIASVGDYELAPRLDAPATDERILAAVEDIRTRASSHD